MQDIKADRRLTVFPHLQIYPPQNIMYRLAQKIRLSILAIAVALTASMLVSACASSVGDYCDATHSCCSSDGLVCNIATQVCYLST
ncbi:hypothetical protein BDR07DRAFT_922832 [Suillus spraguei]|nr:hypothetical protein BDR07DRAFT_922832 [Suillus spraguei]